MARTAAVFLRTMRISTVAESESDMHDAHKEDMRGA
jgi:hypothetical protein